MQLLKFQCVCAVLGIRLGQYAIRAAVRFGDCEKKDVNAAIFARKLCTFLNVLSRPVP